MVQATKPTNPPISQSKIVLPPKISEPKTQLESVGASIEQHVKKSLKYLVKKFDVLSPTTDDLKHPIVQRKQNPTHSEVNEPVVPLPPKPINSLSILKYDPPENTTTQTDLHVDGQDTSQAVTQDVSQAVTQNVSQVVTQDVSQAVTQSLSKGDSPPDQQIDLNVLPPLSQTENQNSNEPPPPTYLHPAPGTAPPANPLTPIPTSASIFSSPQSIPNTNAQAVSKKKLVGYFVVGFLFNLLFCVPIILWLALKSRNGTKQKFLAYLSGLIGSFLVIAGLNYYIMQLVTSNNPSLAYIPIALSNQFPSMKFSTSIFFQQDLGTGNAEPTKTLTVNVSAPTDLSPEMFKQIGTATCNSLDTHGETYNNVVVNQVGKRSILFLKIDTYIGVGQTCQEWYNQPPPNPIDLLNEFNLPPS